MHISQPHALQRWKQGELGAQAKLAIQKGKKFREIFVKIWMLSQL